MPRTRANEAERLFILVDHSARLLREMDRKHNVTGARLSALATLVERGPMSPSELAALEGVSVSGTCRLIREIKAIGLVRCRPEKDNRRVIRIEPTAAGRRLLDRMRQQKIGLFRKQLAKVPSKDRAAVRRALEILEPGATLAAR
ncbi:MAG TPA: MarR family transcriptional regulator [Myxococcota bacterium]|nr:MarR family transcriptional regulator [Myxococcota bacterium]